MLALRGLQRLKSVFSQHRNTSLRSLTNASNVVQQKDDAIVKMDNPYKEPQKRCLLCSVTVDYKNIQLLSQFISPHTGRIYGRHITGLCGKKQKEVSKAIKKAHSLGFMSVTHKHPQFMKDPNICGVRHRD
ncbi:28S ribosomal protein S18c, mitochondrial [Anabas testudineus]|uniref:Small ribosomal subunit protein bS18m n=1 Tax=Anabas testudineus TaxID=64144 RepID=A0A7N6BMR2_ANATE|nr:28S ribosomal protein S18c, mitochondrial [Anabas testudineus]